MKQAKGQEKESKSLFDQERVFYTRMSPRGKRNIVVIVDKLTPEQKQKFDEVEVFLLGVAEEASDETRTSLKGK